jgi:ParB-like chromosome segregation protein Spo0J
MGLVTTVPLKTRKRVEMAMKQTAHTLSREVLRAEEELRRPGESDAPVTDVRPGDVETRMALFQPRMLTHGGHVVDAKYVKKLSRRIGTKGELDPILVVKLGSAWVCVDGHHRLEAYAKRKWEGTIKANWFVGTVRDAVAESLRLNEVDKLEMSSQDRFEAAWQRTVLGWGKAPEIALEANVSLRLAYYMQEVREAYHGMDLRAASLRSKLGALEENTWGRARSTYLGLAKGEERSLQDKAATLAKQLTKKMTDFLSRDPEVTALALQMYDRDLPQPLAGYLKDLITRVGDDDGEEALELPTVPKAALRDMSDEQLMESLERNQEGRAYLASKRVDLEREQDRRASLGTPLEVPGMEPTEVPAICDANQAVRPDIGKREGPL